jgi:hypothetical protein
MAGEQGRQAARDEKRHYQLHSPDNPPLLNGISKATNNFTYIVV